MRKDVRQSNPDAEFKPVSPNAVLNPFPEGPEAAASYGGSTGSGGERGADSVEGEVRDEKGDEADQVQDEVPLVDDVAEGSGKARPVPRSPSHSEIRVHNATHVPFRSWCPKCVAGRAHQSGHFEAAPQTDSTPMVSIDYCFLRRTESSEQLGPTLKSPSNLEQLSSNS